MILIEIKSAGMNFVVDKDKQGRARLIHFSPLPFNSEEYDEDNYSKYHTLVELHALGCDTNDHHASRHTMLYPGFELKYKSHKIEQTENGQKLTVTQEYNGLWVESVYIFYNDAAAVRSFVNINNLSETSYTFDYISSFAFYGLAKNHPSWDDETYLCVPYNSWHQESQWRKHSIWDLGITKADTSSLRKYFRHQTGTWSSSEYLPTAIYLNPDEGVSHYWQIENNGSWYEELGNASAIEGLYIQLGGPNYEFSHFLKTLNRGESFTTVPVAVGCADGGFDRAVGEMTEYRRIIRRKNEDNEKLPIIFNDYMNCLMGDPCTESELPLIEAAAAAGAEYFVVDAGWFTELTGGDDSWWSSIGIWNESKRRFPNGFSEVFDYIRKHNMKPGLWVEIEGIGSDSPLAGKLPDDWFFSLNNRRTKEHYRYQLDFGNPRVREFCNNTLDELIERYGLKYLKLDYNINAGIGSNTNADSVGGGLLDHCRAYIQWIDEFFERHPDVVIENCASGGQRIDYALLSRLSIQSTSDQTHYELYPSISAMSPAAVTPEQNAFWTYPNYKGDEEETVFNMVNAMLGRVHLSGMLNRLPPNNFARVVEGINCYKEIREDIKTALPMFPLGIITLKYHWAAAALRCSDKNKIYLSVWRKDSSEDTALIPLGLKGIKAQAVCRYPTNAAVDFGFDKESGNLCVRLPDKRTARFFVIKW